jgi:hypothetical protein
MAERYLQQQREVAQMLPPNPRPTSAPPNMELSKQSLFAFNESVPYTRIFTDIRCEDTYNDFYERYRETHKLPPPLEPHFMNLVRPATNGGGFLESEQWEEDSGFQSKLFPPEVIASGPVFNLLTAFYVLFLTTNFHFAFRFSLNIWLLCCVFSIVTCCRIESFVSLPYSVCFASLHTPSLHN